MDIKEVIIGEKYKVQGTLANYSKDNSIFREVIAVISFITDKYVFTDSGYIFYRNRGLKIEKFNQ